MMKHLKILSWAAAALVALPVAAHANEPRQHDRGFFLRLSGGPGYARTGIDGDFLGEPIDVDFHGLAGDVDLAVGWVPWPDTAVHATFFGWSVEEPTVEVDGVSEEADDVRLDLSGFGVGVTHYLGASNVYLTGSIGAGTLEADIEDEDEEDSDYGVMAEVGVGKEWWVGGRWGLGVAGFVGYHSLPADGDLGGRFKGTSFAVRFSATFN